MLWWGAVIAVPIALHLLLRRRRQTVSWPAMMLLQAVVRRRTRRVQLWQWLLLLARVAAVLLLAAALANPVLRSAMPATAAVDRTQVFVLDASYSMRTDQGGGRSRFDVAVQRSVQACRDAPPGTQFLVLLMQDPPQAVVSQRTADRDAVIAELEGLRCSFAGAPAADTLALLDRWCTAIEDDAPLAVTFFTDAQRRTWQPIVDGATRAGSADNDSARAVSARGSWQSLLEQVQQVDIVDVTAGEAAGESNRTLAELEALADDRVGVAARAAASASPTTLEVHVDQQTVYSGRLEWNQQGTARTEIPLLPAVETTVVRAELSEDVLGVDNRRYLVRQPPRPLRAVCVGRPEATRFLATALSAGSESAYDVSQRSAADLPQLDAQPIDLLMLCDVARISPGAAEAIASIARRGAAVVWWLGPAAEPDGYQHDPSVVPFRLREAAPAAWYPVDPLGYQHSIAASFAPYPQSGLLSTPVFRFWRIDALDPEPNMTGRQTALALGSDAAPWVLTWQRSQQRTVAITSAPTSPQLDDSNGSDVAEGPWNALVAWPSLVPLVQEIAAWATAPRRSTPSLLVGQRFASDLFAGRPLPARVLAPEQVTSVPRLFAEPASAADARAGGAELQAWTSSPVLQPGVYTLQWPEHPSQQVAVNVDPREGHLERVAAADLSRLEVDNAAAPSQPAVDGAAEETRGGWFRALLTAALACLVAESLISRFALRWQA